MDESETLYDIVDGLQRSGVLPGGDSLLLRTLFAASRIPAELTRARRRIAQFT